MAHPLVVVTDYKLISAVRPRTRRRFGSRPTWRMRNFYAQTQNYHAAINPFLRSESDGQVPQFTSSRLRGELAPSP